MIHIHGGPITPVEVAAKVWKNRHAMVSFAATVQLGVALDVAAGVYFDNGAFSHWRAGKGRIDTEAYYRFVDDHTRHPKFVWACIPDVIDGTEDDNDKLLMEWPFEPHFGVPIWHLHESLERLRRLCFMQFPTIALGSSGEYKTPNSGIWWKRMEQAMDVICDDQGRPRRRLHGLRQLNPAIVSRIPYTSCDAVTVATNIGIDKKWTDIYKQSSKTIRALAYAEYLESTQSPPIWIRPTREEKAA